SHTVRRYNYLPSLSFFFHCSVHHLDLPSFPTRRSSDLHSLVCEIVGGVLLAGRSGFDACEHGPQRLGFCSLAGCVPATQENRIWLSRRLLPGCGAGFLPGLPRSAVRCPSPAIEMAHWRNA